MKAVYLALFTIVAANAMPAFAADDSMYLDTALKDGWQYKGQSSVQFSRDVDGDETQFSRLEVEHRVEGRDLEDSDPCHLKHLRDDAHSRFAHPAFLVLRPPQKRDHRRGLTPRRIFCDLAPRPREIGFAEGEGRGLVFSEAADGHLGYWPIGTSRRGVRTPSFWQGSSR